jgi:hypothetical protein
VAAGYQQHGGDRHSIIVQPGTGLIWETWQAQLIGNQWQASNGAKFDLNNNTCARQDGLQGCGGVAHVSRAASL